MADLSFDKYNVLGISTCVPSTVRRTTDFEDEFGEEFVKKYIKNVGIIQGHVCSEGMTASDLCMSAAERLMDELSIDRDSIDVLLFVSQTPDYIAPSTACLLQHRLGLSNDCMAYDINLACSGYVYGMSAALSYLQVKGINRVLLLCGDTVSKHCSPSDRTLTVLSTDAGSATLLERSTDRKKNTHFSLRTIGKGYRNLIVPYGGYRHRVGCLDRTEREPGILRNDYDGYMNGAEVFKFSITEVPKLIKGFRERFAAASATISKYMLHQANLFILNNIAKRIGVQGDQMPISIDRYGNTGAATIPVTICDCYASSGPVSVTDNIFLCGFGIGLSLGVGIVELKDTLILPIFTSDAEFEDNIDNLHEETSEMVRKSE